MIPFKKLHVSHCCAVAVLLSLAHVSPADVLVVTGANSPLAGASQTGQRIPVDRQPARADAWLDRYPRPDVVTPL